MYSMSKRYCITSRKVDIDDLVSSRKTSLNCPDLAVGVSADNDVTDVVGDAAEFESTGHRCHTRVAVRLAVRHQVASVTHKQHVAHVAL